MPKRQRKYKPKGGRSSQTIAQTSGTSRTRRPAVDPRFRSGMTASSVAKPLNPFPPVFRCIMTGTALGAIAPSAGSSNRYSVYLNTPYQWLNTSNYIPTLSGGSSLGMDLAGFTSLCAADGPYQNFRVFGACLRVELLTANAGDNMLFVIAPQATPPYSTAAQAAGGWGSARRFVGFGNGGRSMIERAWSIADIAGVAPVEVLTNDDWAGTYGSPPPQPVSADIWYATADGSTNSGTITLAVSIAVDVVFEFPQWGAYLEDVSEAKSESSASTSATKSAKMGTPSNGTTVAASATAQTPPPRAALKLAGWNAARKAILRANASDDENGDAVAAKAATKKG